MTMQRFLKIVGNGQRTMRDFTTDEAIEAMEMVLNGTANDVQVAVLMAALRIKEESQAELTAFTQVMRRYSEHAAQTPPHTIDVCVPYDGRAKTPVLLTASIFIAAACGVHVGMHGRVGLNTPPKFGVGVGDVLAALDIPVNLSLKQAVEMLEKTQIAFVTSAQFVPKLETYLHIRRDYGMRSFFNTVEKLLNPFGASSALVGIYHYPVMRRVTESMQALGYARGLAIQGAEGSIDVLVSRRTPILEFTESKPDINEWALDPNEFGWWESALEKTTSFTAQEQADLTLKILNPSETLPPYYRRGAILTAALMLYAAGLAPSVAEGVKHATEVLENGAAQARLKSLQPNP
jgi:anthranilate phosphoribosyltransferase